MIHPSAAPFQFLLKLLMRSHLVYLQAKFSIERSHYLVTQSWLIHFDNQKGILPIITVGVECKHALGLSLNHLNSASVIERYAGFPVLLHYYLANQS